MGIVKHLSSSEAPSCCSAWRAPAAPQSRTTRWAPGRAVPTENRGCCTPMCLQWVLSTSEMPLGPVKLLSQRGRPHTEEAKHPARLSHVMKLPAGCSARAGSPCHPAGPVRRGSRLSTLPSHPPRGGRPSLLLPVLVSLQRFFASSATARPCRG